MHSCTVHALGRWEATKTVFRPFHFRSVLADVGREKPQIRHDAVYTFIAFCPLHVRLAENSHQCGIRDRFYVQPRHLWLFPYCITVWEIFRRSKRESFEIHHCVSCSNSISTTAATPCTAVSSEPHRLSVQCWGHGRATYNKLTRQQWRHTPALNLANIKQMRK